MQTLQRSQEKCQVRYRFRIDALLNSCGARHMQLEERTNLFTALLH